MTTDEPDDAHRTGDGAMPDNLGDDLLHGADEIAGFVLGDPRQRRKIYHLAGTGRIPVFRLGTMICARRKVLLRGIEEQERRVPSSVGGHHRRGDKRKDKPDAPTPTPACPPRGRGPVPTSGTELPVPRA